MKPWKIFALALLALNLGIGAAVGLVWWRSSQGWEHEEWFEELDLSGSQEDRLWELVEARFETQDAFFEGLDEEVDKIIGGLENPEGTRADLMILFNQVEAERGAISRTLFSDLMDFLLTLEPEQRVEVLFFLFETEDLAIWFF